MSVPWMQIGFVQNKDGDIVELDPAHATSLNTSKT